MELKDRIQVVCLCVCLLTQVSLCLRTTKFETEEGPRDIGNLIMKEDAEEVFYNVDLEKYDGVQCPKPFPPEHGSIVGSGTQVGSVLYVQCEEGYTLHGPTVMSCMPFEDGARWDPVVERYCLSGNTHFDESRELSETPKSPENAELKPVVKEVSQEQTNEFPPFVYQKPKVDYSTSSKDNEEENMILHKDVSETKAEIQPIPEVVADNAINPVCLLPPETGTCKAYFLRYYYDEEAKECRKFVYGGCHGNENNFNTLDECNAACSTSADQ